MRHRRLPGALVTATLLLGTLAGTGSHPGTAAGEQKATPKVVRALTLRDRVDAASPEALVWKRAPVVRVPLQPAAQVHPVILGAPSTMSLAVQAIRTPESLYVRLRWDDPNADVSINGTGGFLDRVAVQFPINLKPTTTPFMGDPSARVSIWHWRADGKAESLVAAGFGSLTPASVQDVRATGVRTPRGWEVVITRPLRTTSEDSVRLDGVREIPVAFAVWNGSNQERDGFKAVTLEWWRLRF